MIVADFRIETMMMGERFVGKTILEPSAGKGNIVDWLLNNGAGKVIACENDPNIRKLLDGKCPIIAEDFLTVTSDMISHVDYIVMNPPFSHGAEHILHAYEIAPAGCTIIALCNDSSLSPAYWREKNEQLCELVELHGMSETLGDVFSSDAERTTKCWVALVKLYKEGEKEMEFEDYFFSKKEDTENPNGEYGVLQYNVVRDLVNRYVGAVRLFDETMEATNRINQMAEWKDDSFYGYLPIRFEAVDDRGHKMTITHDQYKKELQKYYWRVVFSKLHMEKFATKQLREQINLFVEKQTHIPFTMKNIYRMLDLVFQTTGQRMQKTLVEAFNTICKFSAENYTAGTTWKTNSNYMVNRRFIIPYMCRYEPQYCIRNEQNYVDINFHGYVDEIEDVVKALCYITGTEYDRIPSLRYIAERNAWGKWFDWGFFRCKGFKKGTMHFEFLDEEVWMKFNLEVAKIRGWELLKQTTKKTAKRA